MKNTNFNRLLMVLLMSVGAGLSAKVDTMKSVDVLPIGYESLDYIEETDGGPQYRIRREEKPHYRAEASPVEFTVETPAVAIVGEDASNPLMAQISDAKEKLQSMRREEDAKNLAVVVYELENANHEIQTLSILESDKDAYDNQVKKSLGRLDKAEKDYERLTHGKRARH